MKKGEMVCRLVSQRFVIQCNFSTPLATKACNPAEEGIQEFLNMLARGLVG